jgi:nitrous oxidase accessory protein NosD
MKGDFTRDTFDPKKHYSSVRMQQGRVQLDADVNEQVDIQTYRRRVTSSDLIGVSGGPKGNDANGEPLAGFKIIAETGQLRLTKGRYYVDGILCENESDLIIKPGQILPGITTASIQSDGTHLLYLDVWERHITALEDTNIREIALGGPDTSTRTKVTWEVRVEKNAVPANTTPDCASFENWEPQDKLSTGRMKARLHRGDSQPGPCEAPAGEYYRLENQLYRVEIHKGGKAQDATFKWSRENGSVVAHWSKASGDGKNLTIKDATPQQRQGFEGGHWIEVSDDFHELVGRRGVLAKLLDADGDVLTIDPNSVDDPINNTATSINPAGFTLNPKIRRWDSDGAIPLKDVTDPSGWVELEENIQVFFDPQGTYQTGDYWLIPVRSEIDDLQWPLDTNDLPKFQPKQGIAHHYSPIALIQVTGNQVAVKDCRKLFPPATNITADDVYFDNTICEMKDVKTVQDALDILCHQKGGACTLVAVPGKGWESVFEKIKANQDAQICFPVGDYPYSGKTPITIKDKGGINLKITGSGPGTRIIADKTESALAFEECGSVSISSLYAESKAAGMKGAKKHLNGVLSFLDVPNVTVENTSLKCRSGPRRMATCITVRNSDQALGGRAKHASARIRHNDLNIGFMQSGILLVNVARVQVEDNTLVVVKKPRWLTWNRLVKDVKYRSALRHALFSEISLSDVTLSDTGESVSESRDTSATSGRFARARAEKKALTMAGYEVSFMADKSVATDLLNLFNTNPPSPSTTTKAAVTAHLNLVVDKLILKPENIAAIPGLKNWLDTVKETNPAVASQGIVVGGRKAEDVRILNNTIHGVLQGIHIGQSRRLQDRDPKVVDRTERLQVFGNTVSVLLPMIIPYERHGIFCGNCDSLAIENNKISILRGLTTKETHIDGIRVFGQLGRMVKVCQNHIKKPTVGIYFNPLNEPLNKIPKSMWLFADNMVENPVTGEALEVGDRPRKVETSEERQWRLNRNKIKRGKVKTRNNIP